MFRLKKSWGRGEEIINVYKYTMAGDEDRARLFSVVPSDRARGSRHKLRDIRFQPRTRKHFFFSFFFLTMRVVRCQNRTYREVLEISLGCRRVFLPIFQRKSIHCQPSVHTYRNRKLTSENQDGRSLSSAQVAAMGRGEVCRMRTPQLLRDSPVTMRRDQARRAACLCWATALGEV